MTIITGANGSGKTTILSLLAQHRGWPAVFAATPLVNKVTGAIENLVRWFKGEDKSADRRVATIVYGNGARAEAHLPSNGSAAFQLQLSGQQSINCIFIPSHRQTFRYEPIQTIPVAKKTEQDAFNEVYSVSVSRYQGGGGQSASFFMKTTLIGWAIQGHGVQGRGKAIMPSDAKQREAYEGFQEALRKLLPKSLGFKEFEIRNMEIVFVCNDGNDEFILETASGGVSALVDLTWQLYMFSRGNPGPFTAIIDEAENHLHPTLQRALLPSLLEAFPQATFIVSTHSPLVVGSVRDASVYVLRYGHDKKVQSSKLDLEGKAKGATDILDEVLGVSSTLPIWVEQELSRILGELNLSGSNPERFGQLRERLEASGLGHLVPQAITQMVEGQR